MAVKLFFAKEDAEIREVIIRRLHRFTQIQYSDFGHSFVIRHSRFVICDHPVIRGSHTNCESRKKKQGIEAPDFLRSCFPY
jgi:hypothetical protein